jgi:glucokinase
MTNQSAIGVDLGGTQIKCGAVNAIGEMIITFAVPTEAEQGPVHVIDQIGKAVREILDKTNSPVKGIGIGSPGSVSLDGNTVSYPPNFPGWEVVRLAEKISEKFHIPAKVENDANVAALGEARFGAGRDEDNFLMITLGTGVGGGIILDDQIYRGVSGSAGEIGHISIDYRGVRCNCGGIGCLEAYVGQKYLSQRTAAKLRGGARSKITELIGGDLEKIEPKIISEAADAGDQFAVDVLTETGTMIGAAMASVLNILDLRTIVVGGGVAAAGKILFDAIQSSASARVVPVMRTGVRVIPALLGNKAGILGAASLIL